MFVRSARGRRRLWLPPAPAAAGAAVRTSDPWRLLLVLSGFDSLLVGLVRLLTSETHRGRMLVVSESVAERARCEPLGAHS